MRVIAITTPRFPRASCSYGASPNTLWIRRPDDVADGGWFQERPWALEHRMPQSCDGAGDPEGRRRREPSHEGRLQCASDRPCSREMPLDVAEHEQCKQGASDRHRKSATSRRKDEIRREWNQTADDVGRGDGDGADQCRFGSGFSRPNSNRIMKSIHASGCRSSARATGTAASALTPYDVSTSITSLASAAGMSRTSACSRRRSLA